jgi:putative flippase GtrA
MSFYYRHPKLVRSAGVSLCLMPIGFGLLCLGVSVFGWAKWTSNLAAGVVMNPLGFWAQRRYGFQSEETIAREGFSLWMAKTGVTSGFNAGIFTVLVESYGLPMGLVRWGLNFTVGPVSYFINKRWIFKGRNPLSRLTEPLITAGVILCLVLRLWMRKKCREFQMA